MGAQVVDYRISTLVVLCKDCGNDVGLYPARHKCQPIDRPAMPALPAQFMKNKTEQPKSNLSALDTVEDTEESVYFNNFAVNLPEQKEQTGKKLWGKVRENEKWKQLNEKNEKTKASGKIWGKLIQATQNVADKMPSKDERGAESDEDDWDGETHVSRILREYYESKRMRLPEWLFEEAHSPKKSIVRTSVGHETVDVTKRNSTRRRLWDQDPTDTMSNRERERQELRQAQSMRQDREDPRRHQEEEERPMSHRYRPEGHREYEAPRDYDRYRPQSPEKPRRDDYRRDDYHRRDDYRSDNYRSDEYRSDNYRNDDYRSDNYRREPQPYPTKQQAHYYEDNYRSPNPSYSPNRQQQQQQRRFDQSDQYYSTREYDSYKKQEDYYDSRHYPASPMDRAPARHNQSPPPPDTNHRAPSLRGTRRYGNDPNYF